MTRWGFALLLVYVGVGIGKRSWRNASRGAVLLTAVVIVGVFASYGALR